MDARQAASCGPAFQLTMTMSSDGVTGGPLSDTPDLRQRRQVLDAEAEAAELGIGGFARGPQSLQARRLQLRGRQDYFGRARVPQDVGRPLRSAEDLHPLNARSLLHQ